MMKRMFVLFLMFGFVFSQSAFIINSTNGVTDVYSSSAHKVHVDTFGINPDLGLRLCAAGQRYVAAVYSADLGGGSYEYIAVSWNLSTGSDKTLVFTDVDAGGGCYYTSIDAYAFSQFRDNTRTPPVHVSAFPGRIHALYSNNVDGSSPAFVAVNYSNGWLRGSYLTTLTFNQGTGQVTADVNSITFETDVGSITKAPSDADWGLSSSTGRSMLIALCSDDIGDGCSDAVVANDSGDLPVQLSLGSPANDQVVNNSYVVVNGLGYPICIGSDLAASVSANPGSIYYNHTSNITVTLTNNGNVDVTTDFTLMLNITGPGAYINSTTWTITETIPASGGTTQRSMNWTADGQSGAYTATAYGDVDEDIVECSEANNNASTGITVSPVYVLHVEIDGNDSDIFPIWGRPYNVTMWLTDSDGNFVANPRYVITETNGLNFFAPTQVWNSGGTDYGLKTYNMGEMTGNNTGHIRITLAPTCNLLYTTYAAENVDLYVGNYSIMVNAYSGGSPLMLLYNNSLTTDYPLSIGDYTCADPGWVNNKELVNKNKYVLWIYDWIYQMYIIAKKLVVP